MPDEEPNILKVTSHRPGASWTAHRNRTAPPDMIVLHETAGASAFSSYGHGLTVGTGYTFIIDRPWKAPQEFNDPKWDGQIWQMAPLIDPGSGKHQTTSHVGSKIKMAGSTRSINDRAIGISIANMMDGKDKRTKLQRASLLELIIWLKTEVPTLKYITTHYDIQCWNRRDPLGFDPTFIDDIVGLEYVRPTDAQLLAAAKKFKEDNPIEGKHAVSFTQSWIAKGRPIPT